MRRTLLWVAAPVLVIGAVALAGGFSRSPTARARTAPALPTTVLVAPAVDIASLRGRPAVVNFWASWCGPCRREAPALERFARGLGARGRLVGVNWNDAADGARAFIRRYGWTFPNLRDGDGAVGNDYGLTGLPTTFILDSQGRIVRRLTGAQTVPEIDAALRAVHG